MAGRGRTAPHESGIRRCPRAARERIGLAVQDLSGMIGPWFEAYREARTALDAAGGSPLSFCGRGAGGVGGLPFPVTKAAGEAVAWGKLSLPAAPQAVKWQYALDDMRDQLARLPGRNA